MPAAPPPPLPPGDTYLPSVRFQLDLGLLPSQAQGRPDVMLRAIVVDVLLMLIPAGAPSREAVGQMTGVTLLRGGESALVEIVELPGVPGPTGKEVHQAMTASRGEVAPLCVFSVRWCAGNVFLNFMRSLCASSDVCSSSIAFEVLARALSLCISLSRAAPTPLTRTGP